MDRANRACSSPNRRLKRLTIRFITCLFLFIGCCSEVEEQGGVATERVYWDEVELGHRAGR